MSSLLNYLKHIRQEIDFVLRHANGMKKRLFWQMKRSQEQS
jgi:hypothetical protein